MSLDAKKFVLDVLRQYGLETATEIQFSSSGMTGTELNEKKDYIPDFAEAVKVMNMLDRHAGQDDGFVCQSTAGRVVRLIQNYDSTVYTQEPEELLAQWRFVWSQNPYEALDFMALSTSPYATGDIASKDGRVYVSGQDGNVWEPGTINVKWTDVGPVGGPFEGYDEDGNPVEA